jgi:hypothetical protein
MSLKTNRCPVCKDNKILEKFLGRSTITGYVCKTEKESINQPIFNIKINFCLNCNVLFQSHVKGAEKILKNIYANHQLIFRNSKFYQKYYQELIKTVKSSLDVNKENKIIEIGANDGSFLKKLSSKIKASFFAVESSKIVKNYFPKNITLLNNFFNLEIANKIKKKYGTMDYIIVRHVLEHIKNPKFFFKLLNKISNSETVMLIEVPYLVSIFKFKRFENISYSHLIHYNVKSMTLLANSCGFFIFKYKLVKTDGGSIVFFLKKNPKDTSLSIIPKSENKRNFLFMFKKFCKLFIRSQKNFDNFIKKNFKKKRTIGFGAGAKGQFLIHMYNMKNHMKYVIDETKFYCNKFIPGTNIKIINLKKALKMRKSLIINLAPTHYPIIKNKIGSKHQIYDLINN